MGRSGLIVRRRLVRCHFVNHVAKPRRGTRVPKINGTTGVLDHPRGVCGRVRDAGERGEYLVSAREVHS